MHQTLIYYFKLIPQILLRVNLFKNFPKMAHFPQFLALTSKFNPTSPLFHGKHPTPAPIQSIISFKTQSKHSKFNTTKLYEYISKTYTQFPNPPWTHTTSTPSNPQNHNNNPKFTQITFFQTKNTQINQIKEQIE